MSQDAKPLFRALTADDPDPEITEIESLCLNCGKNGTTRLLLTKIPHFKEVVIMSFDCSHCGFQNNEIQPGGNIDEKGIRINLSVKSHLDLNRQVVKSDFTSIKIPEIDFEIPSQSQKGEVTTIEGILERAVEGLTQDQSERRKTNPIVAEQLDAFIVKIKDLIALTTPFTMIFEDISGNSFVSNPSAPQKDHGCETHLFVRNKDEDHALGIYTPAETGHRNPTTLDNTSFTLDDLQSEILQFATNCPNCATPCSTNMKLTNIPHFREVVIMATNCEACGHRSNEVKSSGGIEPQGLRIEIKVNGKEDFSRDVLKSETCSLEIPELDLEVGPAALGGRFTTVEGLIDAMKEQLAGRGAMFSDIAPGTDEKMNSFLAEMDKILAGERPITLVFDDPAGNSYVQSLCDPEPDPALKVERYERTFEQNDDLGLNDMKTENYESS